MLAVLASAIPIEAAYTMQPEKTGPYAMTEDPPVWAQYRQVFKDAGLTVQLSRSRNGNSTSTSTHRTTCSRFKRPTSTCSPTCCWRLVSG